MPFNYSVMLDLTEKNVLVVGGGQVALRKIGTLIESGAKVRVISPDCVSTLKELARTGKILYEERPFQLEDIVRLSPFIVFAATDDEMLNAQIAQYCNARNILINSITQPQNGNISVQAKLERPNYALSISTYGQSPGFSKALKNSLDQKLDATFDEAVQIYIEIRQWLFSTYNDVQQRQIYLQKLDLDAVCNLIGDISESHDEKLERVKEWLSCSLA